MRNALYNIENTRAELVNTKLFSFPDIDAERLFYKLGITMDVHQHSLFKELPKPSSKYPIIGAGSSYHYYYQDLACLHVDIICNLFEYEYLQAVLLI